MRVSVGCEDPCTQDAQLLLDECAATLALYSGDGGQSRFRLEEVCSARGAFVVARTRQGAPLGCGAFRRFDYGVAELMRIYCRRESGGAGQAILDMLETEAMTAGYRTLIAQTNDLNRRALAFFERHGFEQIEPVGASMHRANVLCFARDIAAQRDGDPAASKHADTDPAGRGESR
ncbi:GNAT family N-acetyltransferase [Paraburkholderia phymatum]|uniref:GCN5-related N-acetyltransferase n=1 Tax=Paraburkholderia phymatum (strain DSM 17167 / CIP 108236 / LMG 21445 / STM815) TaxID=391038 RepID=B2JLF3_PARP8|nr:GNAT family N-acetyltransferase [Paraburkholderia phymatum]ACC74121.1 GCN5-related N-acetyltransferase [Paraburkholderia phymatum STM815]